MRKLVLSVVVFCLTANAVTSQSSNPKGMLKYYNCNSDKMNYKEGFVPDANHHWVETDESFGEVFLTFNYVNNSKTPTAVNLILNIPDVTDAQSNTGVVVYADNQIIGKASQVSANSSLKISLDLKQITGKNQIVLILRGGGADGMAILSKASGFGPVLEFVY